MDEVKPILDSIPAAAWAAAGAVFGAVVAFIASIILNYGNNRRLKIQLEHDGAEKNVDRMNALRREVYLSAVEEMAKASGYLASLPSRDLAKTNISEDLQGLFASAAKLSLVGSPKTQLAMDMLGVAYTKLVFDILQRLGPLQDISSNIALNIKMYEQVMVDVHRVLGELTLFSESTQTDEYKHAALQSSFDFFNGQAQKFNEDRESAQIEFNRLLGVFNNELFRDMEPIARLQIEVMISVRTDLGVETDSDDMRKRSMKQWGEIIGSANDALDKMSKQ
jgi:predicted metal-dependent hydrolase